jgi:hypothetical protein
MTKTQVRELKMILATLASRLRSDALDDPMRMLCYRAQALADDELRVVARDSLSKVG